MLSLKEQLCTLDIVKKPYKEIRGQYSKAYEDWSRVEDFVPENVQRILLRTLLGLDPMPSISEAIGKMRDTKHKIESLHKNLVGPIRECWAYAYLLKDPVVTDYFNDSFWFAAYPKISC